jgi:hypothetical protein
MDKTEIIMDRIAQRMVEMSQQRGPDKTLSPSEVAQAVVNQESEWRTLMPLVREVACMLNHRNIIQIERDDQPIQVDDPDDIQGAIRLRIHPDSYR